MLVSCNDAGRGCIVDTPLQLGFSEDTGLGLMVEHGIDYDNRLFITEIYKNLQAYFGDLLLR